MECRESAGIGEASCGHVAAARARLRRPLAGFLLALALTLCALAALASSALAVEVHHTLDPSATIKGSAKCPLEEPGEMAVNESTGQIYVVEHKRHRVERFSAGGECLGWWVVADPGAIAVDNSGGPSEGDVYVAGATEKELEERYEVKKYTPEGKLIFAFKKFRINPPEVKPGEFREFEELGEIMGLGVDAKGRLWVYTPEAVTAFDDAEKNVFEQTIELGVANCAAMQGLAVTPSGEEFYLGRDRELKNETCEEAQEIDAFVKYNNLGSPVVEPPYQAQLDAGPTFGGAVDPTNSNVYFDNGTSISAFDSAGRFVERFAQTGGEALGAGRGLAVDGHTNTVYAADEFAQVIDVYTVAPPPEPPKTAPPDGREWQLVSPSLKHGSSVLPNLGDAGLVKASEDGSAITYDSNAPIVENPPVNRAPEPSVNLSRRGSEGWATQDLGTPRTSSQGYTAGQGTEWRFFSSDLARGIVTPEMGVTEPHETPLSPAESETTIYLRDLTAPAGACEPIPSTCYEPFVSSLNTTATGYGGQLKFLTASPDARHAVFIEEVPVALTGEPVEGPFPLYEWTQGPGGGTLQAVNTPPAGEPGAGAGAQIGEADPRESEQKIQNMRHAINNDGSRVVWAAGGRLYVRDTARHETVRLDLAEEGMPPAEEPEEASFRIADAEGKRIFFTDQRPLTKNSTSEEGAIVPEGQADLYVCELVEHEGKLACALQDLTTTVASTKEAASVQQVVGASEDGTYIYYVANGVLAPGAGRGHCNVVTEEEETGNHLNPVSCNLYVSHLGPKGWEAPRFVSKLTTAERADWQAATARHGLTSRVSPNGLFLSFMSNSSLTGYNNTDAVSGAQDQEVYVYDASTGKLACASCNPSGAQPHGVLDQIHSGEGNGLVVDRPFLWQGQTLAGDISGWTSNVGDAGLYLARNLSDSGRMFFNSPDALVPADTNGKMDVYEYEPNGVGTCTSATGCIALISSGTSAQESAFMDASANGEDAFIYTSAQLQPEVDHDGGFDVYDAQVCRESAPCNHPKPIEESRCTTEASESTCKPPPSEVPALPPAPPSTLSGPGNSGTIHVLPYAPHVVLPTPPKPETNAQKLARALKQCRKKHNKRKRQACERQARKRYPVKRGKSSRAHGRRRG